MTFSSICSRISSSPRMNVVFFGSVSHFPDSHKAKMKSSNNLCCLANVEDVPADVEYCCAATCCCAEAELWYA